MPSVLIELGFLTNKKEGRFLNSKTGQAKMANEIADAIYGYIKNLKLNTVINEVTTVIPKDQIEFKVQVASGKNKITTKSYNFKGLKNIERIQVGTYYKYYYGNTSSYKDVEKALKTAKSKGYKTAFIVAIKNGEKISVQEALKRQ